MHKLLKWILPIAITSCSNMEETAKERSYYNQYFQDEISQLIKDEKGILKHTTTEDNVEQWMCDTMDREMWVSELRGFLNAPSVITNDTASYIISNDSSGMFQVVRYTAKDTLADLLRWEFTLVNSELQMITWETQEKSILLDRNIEKSYQPQKGFRIQIIEDPIWSDPKMIEVFAEFTN